MYIKEITSRNRRDFHAIYRCEHCGHESTGPGYDDQNFHSVVVPMMNCDKCHKTAGPDCQIMTPKYPEGHQL